jgi:UDP-glucose 4-epimerase
MKLLVTGGAGFIGGNLITRLSDHADITVRVFDNESAGNRRVLGDFGGEFIRGDMRDRAAVAAAVKGMDAVVHLAAESSVMDSIADPVSNFEVNVEGGLHLLEAMRANRVRRLISASTGGAITGSTMPPVHEGMAAAPLSPYGAAKLTMEGYCSAYAASYGWRALSLRFSNVYGPGSFHNESVIVVFFKRILKGAPLVVYGDGEQTRDFIFVEDLCEGIFQSITRDVEGVIQLGSGKPATINELINTMKAVVAPRTVDVEYHPHRPGEVVQSWCEIAKAKAELGFMPTTSLRAGLERTWASFLEQDRDSK